MPYNALISVSCPDSVGLISAVTGRLFDLGGDLGDTSFAVLGAAAELTAIVALPDSVPLDRVRADLAGLPTLADARIVARLFDLKPQRSPSGQVTHRITSEGPDQPGLMARLSEVFTDYDANIVRLSAERVPGEPYRYVIHIAAFLPPRSADACIATLANTAAALGQRLTADVAAADMPSV